jgi:hypothetical protein
MENQAYEQIIGNPNAPFINKMTQTANLATDFSAIGHPSLTNYLEVVGVSNFGVISDHAPDWHNKTCIPNLMSGVPLKENSRPRSARLPALAWMHRPRQWIPTTKAPQ